MAPVLQNIVSLSKQIFRSGLTEANLSTELRGLKELMSQLTAKDINFDEELVRDKVPFNVTANGGRAPVTCVEIYNSPYFTVVMFVLKNNTAIPLHDHPGMCGLLKVVRGSVNITSYSNPSKIFPSLASPPRRITEILRKFPKLNGRSMRSSPTIKLHDRVKFDERSEPVILSPINGNYHEVNACDGPAAFVDVLAPPYDPNSDRDCHYYRDIGSSVENNDSGHSNIHWLVEIPSPYSFWCDSQPYKGPELQSNEH